jgi:hypothetical protein
MEAVKKFREGKQTIPRSLAATYRIVSYAAPKDSEGETRFGVIAKEPVLVTDLDYD